MHSLSRRRWLSTWFKPASTRLKARAKPHHPGQRCQRNQPPATRSASAGEQHGASMPVVLLQAHTDLSRCNLGAFRPCDLDGSMVCWLLALVRLDDRTRHAATAWFVCCRYSFTWTTGQGTRQQYSSFVSGVRSLGRLDEARDGSTISSLPALVYLDGRTWHAAAA